MKILKTFENWKNWRDDPDNIVRNIINGYYDKVKKYIDDGNDINITVENWTPLTAASFHGSIGLITLLLDNGADWNITPEYGRSFFYYLYRNNMVRNEIFIKYPEIEEEYLREKEAKKYNL